MHRRRTRLPIATSAACSALALLLMAAACSPQPVLPRPTEPPTMDIVGTVTAQAVPIVATQTAISAAATQIAQAQATLTAQAEAQSAASTGTAIVQVAGAQVASATAPAGTVSAQNVTSTALPAPNGTLVAQTAGSATPAGTPVPPAETRTPVPTSSLACVAPDPEFATIANKAAAAGLDTGCPVKPAVAGISGAAQDYWANVSLSDPKTHWRSPAIWRGDTQDIYILKGDDTQASKGSLSVYPDLYRDGQPEIPPDCAGMTPPGGSQLPARGFGKVWCDAGLATVIGWPNQREVPATLRIQPTRNGLLMKVSAPDATPPVGYLIAMDFQSGRAVTSLVSP